MVSSAFVAVKLILVSLVIMSLINQNAVGGWIWRRRCSRRNCGVDAWSQWGPCTRGCPAGTQDRHRHVTRKASCGGSCPYKLDEARSCNYCYNGGIGLDGKSYVLPGQTCYCKNFYIDPCCKQSE